MLDNLKYLLKEDMTSRRDADMLSEMATDAIEEDLIFGQDGDDYVPSAEEEQALNKIIESIPEETEDSVEISKDDIKEAEASVAEPSVKDLAESLLGI